jgi:predicted NUDIX family NTP pyrophosphohydrolase
MAKVSAGLLLYRLCGAAPEFLLVHPGGPLWQGRDEGAWSIPKGELAGGEAPLATALREFAEETGFDPRAIVTPANTASPADRSATGTVFVSLGSVRQKSGKIVHAWACCGDCDAGAIKSNTVTLEWPPGSGRRATFPEIDRAEFFGVAEARRKINPAQVALLDALVAWLADAP